MSSTHKESKRLSNPPFLSDNDKVTDSLIQEEDSICQESIKCPEGTTSMQRNQKADIKHSNTVCYLKPQLFGVMNDQLNDSIANCSVIEKLSPNDALSRLDAVDQTNIIDGIDDVFAKTVNELRQKGNYMLGKTLGEGAFGLVKSGTHITTGEKVAIKILDKTRMKEEEDDFNRVKKEINILKKLRHKNVIQLYEIIESQHKLYLVIELCEGKELFDYIVDNQKLEEAEACKFFQELIDGVEYLHSQNIVHRDLKPENLLLDSDKNLKITDFGLSTVYSNDNLLTTPCGTPSYAPPEMLKGEEYHGLLSDVWSCGVILYAMLCGYLPFSESNEDLNCRNIIEGNFEIPDFLSPGVIDLLANVMKIDPIERYDIQQIRQHPWFSTVPPLSCPGIVLEYHKLPIDYDLLSQILKEHFNIDYNSMINDLEGGEDISPELQSNYEKVCSLISKIETNKFDNFTAIYYLTLKKIVKCGYKSISDLKSEVYIEYINSTRCIKDEYLAEINKNSNPELENDAQNNMEENNYNNMVMISDNESEYNYKDTARDKRSYPSNETMTQIKLPRESIISNRSRQQDTQSQQDTKLNNRNSLHSCIIESKESNIELDGNNASHLKKAGDEKRPSVFSRGSKSGKKEAKTPEQNNKIKFNSSLDLNLKINNLETPKDQITSNVKSTTSKTQQASRNNKKDLSTKTNRSRSVNRTESAIEKTQKSSTINGSTKITRTIPKTKKLERKQNELNNARLNKFKLKPNITDKLKTQPSHKKYLEEDLYRLESVEKSPFKSKFQLKNSQSTDKSKLLLSIKENTSPYKKIIAANTLSVTNKSYTKKEYGNNEIFIKKKVALPKKDIIREVTPLKEKYNIKTTKNQSKLQCSGSLDTSKKLGREGPKTTKSTKINYRVNSVGSKVINKSSVNETEKKSSDSIKVGSTIAKKTPTKFGVTRLLSPYNAKQIKSDMVSVYSRKENNKSVNFNNTKLLTMSQNLDSKDRSLVSKSKGKSELHNKPSNILNKSNPPNLNYIRKTPKDHQKSFINILPLDIALDIDCLIPINLEHLIESLEEILKNRKITYVKISRYRYKCSKNGICFNCEILKIEQNESSVLDTPINTYRKNSNTITIGESCTDFNPNLDLDARIMQGNLNNNILEVTSNDTELLINKQGNEAYKKSSLKLNPALGISTDKFPETAAQVYYLQFKCYSGDSAGYKQLIKGVLDLFNKY